MKEKKVVGPILGCILFAVLGFIVYQVIGAGIGGIIDVFANSDGIYQTICCILASIVYLLIYERANKKVFDGCIKSDDMKLGFLIVLPVLILALIGMIFTVVVSKHHLGISAMTLLSSIYAGVCEEITFRAIPAAHMMRCYKDGKKTIIVLILTSLLFSITHATNLFAGADLKYTIIQLLHTFAVGLLYCASYLRSGSIVPAVTMHFINDVIAFLDVDMFASGGVMSNGEMLTTADIVIGIVSVVTFAVVAFYSIRESKREEIMKIWAKKWSKE